MSTSALQEQVKAVQLHCARHCELPLSKMGNQGLFPGRVSEANQGRGQPLRAVCPRNVVRLFRPNGRNWTPRINSGRPTVRLPQAEAWAERERVPSGHNCRRQLATGRPEQIQEPGTAVPGTPIFANNAQRGGPPLESPCRWLSLVLSFASKESTAPSGRQPDHPRRSRRVMLQPRQGVCAYRRTKGLSVRPLETFGHRSWRKPIGQ